MAVIGVSLSSGLLNLTSWLGNVIMLTMAGLFAAAAVYQFSKNRHHHQFAYAALASLMCSGLLRAMESFANQSAWNNPDRLTERTRIRSESTANQTRMTARIGSSSPPESGTGRQPDRRRGRATPRRGQRTQSAAKERISDGSRRTECPRDPHPVADRASWSPWNANDRYSARRSGSWATASACSPKPGSSDAYFRFSDPRFR
jgi:hypothetical protein